MRKKILIILFAALLVITSVVMVSGFMSKDSPVSAADIKLTDLSIDSVFCFIPYKRADNIHSIQLRCSGKSHQSCVGAYRTFGRWRKSSCKRMVCKL